MILSAISILTSNWGFRISLAYWTKMRTLPLAVLQLVLIIQSLQACFFKAPKMSEKLKTVYGPWSDVTFKKDINSANECGKKIKNGDKEIRPWNLEIQAPSANIICPGTIIASNLIATSHECIRLPGKKLHGFDAWKWSQVRKNIVEKEDIIVNNPNTPGESFEVEEIIMNPKFLTEKYPRLDLLLLKIKTDKIDFLRHATLKPICLPGDNNAVDFAGRVGHYDAGGKVNEGVIFTKRMCDREGYNPNKGRKKDDEVTTLCYQFGDGLTMPNKQVGGALVVESSSGQSFLAGIAHDVNVELKGAGGYFVYFTNIISMLKYIEYRADEHKSKWCAPASLELQGWGTPTWPWENISLQEHFKDRDESLDCVCGVPNSGLSGKIVGGREAFPYEFGWMASLNLYVKGRKEPPNICGGAIINDRMILSAAHCFVTVKKISSSTSDFIVKPKDVDLVINTHKRIHDKRGISKKIQKILIHPGFAPAQLLHYFDYDIALIVLEDSLKFPPLPQQGIRPVCLPKIGETIELVNKMSLVTGWGLTHPVRRDSIDTLADKKKTIADKLRKIELPIISLQICKDSARARVTNRFLCAGSLNKFIDAAPGDSGGPLKIKRGRQYTEVGIVSWADENIRGGKSETAALYTDVTHWAILPYIDYFAKRVGVRWCKSKMPD